MVVWLGTHKMEAVGIEVGHTVATSCNFSEIVSGTIIRMLFLKWLPYTTPSKSGKYQHLLPVSTCFFQSTTSNTTFSPRAVSDITISGNLEEISSEDESKISAVLTKCVASARVSVNDMLSTRNKHPDLAPGYKIYSHCDTELIQYTTPSTYGYSGIGRLTLGLKSNVYWERAVQFACILCNTSYDMPSDDVNTFTETILALALGSFCGNYNKDPEPIDDRGQGIPKLCLSRDCDDMAITVAAVCTNLIDAEKFKYTGQNVVAQTLLKFLQETYKTVGICLCQAVAHVAVPGSIAASSSTEVKGHGHVFAFLGIKDGPNMMQNCLVLECTVPACLDSTMVLSNPIYKDRDPGGSRRRRCFNSASCVKRLDCSQYQVCVWVATADSYYLCTDSDNTTWGQSLTDMRTTSSVCSKVPTNAELDRSVNILLATYPIVVVNNLTTVDAFASSPSIRKKIYGDVNVTETGRVPPQLGKSWVTLSSPRLDLADPVAGDSLRIFIFRITSFIAYRFLYLHEPTA